MLGNIGERFLENAEHGNRHILIQFDVLLSARDFAGDAQTLAEFYRLPFDCRNDAKIHDARSQVARHTPYRIDGTVDQLIDGMDLCEQHHVFVSDVAAQPIQVDLDCRQIAAEIIVDLLGDADTLVLSCRHDMR